MSDKAEIEITRKLETVFNRIYTERMTDMPMVNDKLQVAEIIMQALMHTQNQDGTQAQPQQMEAIWKEDVPEIETQAATINKINNPEPERPMISERLQQPLSRRELLRAMFNPNGDKS